MTYKKFLITSEYMPADTTFHSRSIPSLLGETSSAGESMFFVEDEFNLHLFKMVITEQSQSWYWLPDWQKMESEADQNLKDSDFEEFDDLDEFIASL